MRVTYYGRELYHTGAPQKDHKYIDRIPIGNKFRYFYDQAELAAYKAGKALGQATSVAGRGMQVFKDGRKVGKIMEYKGDQFAKRVEGLHNIYKNSYARNPKDNAIIKARQGKSTNPIGRFGAVVSRNVRNVQKNISDTTKNVARTFDRGVNNVKNFAALNFGTTKGKNANMHSNNQGYISKKSAPKYNQGIDGRDKTGQNNTPKYNQGIGPSMVGKNTNIHPNNQGVNITTGKHNTPKYNQGISPTKLQSSKREYDSAVNELTKNVSDNLKKGTPYAMFDPATGTALGKAAVKASQYNTEKKKQQSPKIKKKSGKSSVDAYYNPKQMSPNDNFIGLSKKSTANSINNNSINVSSSERRRSLEKSYIEEYMKMGATKEQARRWAKQAARNDMKNY